MDAEILAILSNAKLPLHAREIRQILARSGASIQEHTVIRELRRLLSEGHVHFSGGRWVAVKKSRAVADAKAPGFTQPFPHISSEALALLSGGIQVKKPVTGFEDAKSLVSPIPQSEDEKSSVAFGGRWGTFRTLLDYYRDCIRNDGGAEAVARLDEASSKFFFVSRPGGWLPRPCQPWSLSVPLGSHLGTIVQQLGSPGQDTLLILGYPVQVIRFQCDGEPDSHLLKPIFHFTLEYSLKKGALLLNIEDPRVQVNLQWLNYSIRGSEGRRAFLSACGFIGNDTDSESRACYVGPVIEHLTATLAAFFPKVLHEPLSTNLIPGDSLRLPLASGIYNRAVIMLARRPLYTRSLLRELSIIRETSDGELDKTSLVHLFRSPQDLESLGNENRFFDGQVADTTPLNSEQRRAVGSLLYTPLTVITGPPGTGKSQVVSAAVANAHLFSQSVLFASRNHKAIDAVYERCQDGMGRPLLVRCNSRDDPNLRFTFVDAIKMMLAENADAAAIEKARQALDNLKGCNPK